MISGFQNEMSHLRESFENKFSQLYNLVYQLALKGGMSASEIHTISLTHQEFSSLQLETPLKGLVNNDSGNYSEPRSLPFVEENNTQLSEDIDEQPLSSLHSYSEKTSLTSKSHLEVEPEQNDQRDESVEEESYNTSVSQRAYENKLDSHVTKTSSEVSQSQKETPSSPLSRAPSSTHAEETVERQTDKPDNKLLVNGRGYKRKHTAEIEDNRMSYFTHPPKHSVELEETLVTICLDMLIV